MGRPRMGVPVLRQDTLGALAAHESLPQWARALPQRFDGKEHQEAEASAGERKQVRRAENKEIKIRNTHFRFSDWKKPHNMTLFQQHLCSPGNILCSSKNSNDRGGSG